MKKATIIILIVICISHHAASQTPLSLPAVDAQTYAYWQQEDWKSLITLGNKALQGGMDFYYLRVRMGIAHFERKNYHLAIHHLNKAYLLNPHDDYLNATLYYAYIYAGRTMEASILLSKFTPSLRQKIGKTDRKTVDAISIFYMRQSIDDESVIENFSPDVPSPENGAQVITRKLDLFNAGIKHAISPKFSLYHAYTHIRKESFAYSVFDGFENSTQDHETTLNQYCIIGNTRISKGLNLLAGFHYINISYPLEVTDLQNGQQIRNALNRVNYNEYVGYLGLYREMNRFTPGAAVSLAGLNQATQLQGDLSVIFYPLGNLNLYTSSMASFQREFYQDQSHHDALVLNQLIGCRITGFLWAEGFFTLGNMKNFVAGNGAIVFNATEAITGRMGGRLIFLPNQQFNLQITYIMNQLESSFTEEANAGVSLNSTNYKNHSLTGGIVWRF